MKFVGLTGSIGTGKSTVAAGLAKRGAVIIDVDVISRELQQPGQPVFAQIVERWGTRVLDADGKLDRAALGRVVFGDREQLNELTMMTASVIENELVRLALLHEGTDRVVVVEAALSLVRMYGMEGLIVVDAPVEVAVARVVQGRGMPEADARSRIASQIPRETRLEHADFVIDNSGTIEELEPRIDAALAWISTLPDATPRVDRSADAPS